MQACPGTQEGQPFEMPESQESAVNCVFVTGACSRAEYCHAGSRAAGQLACEVTFSGKWQMSTVSDSYLRLARCAPHRPPPAEARACAIACAQPPPAACAIATASADALPPPGAPIWAAAEASASATACGHRWQALASAVALASACPEPDTEAEALASAIACSSAPGSPPQMAPTDCTGGRAGPGHAGFDGARRGRGMLFGPGSAGRGGAMLSGCWASGWWCPPVLPAGLLSCPRRAAPCRTCAEAWAEAVLVPPVDEADAWAEPPPEMKRGKGALGQGVNMERCRTAVLLLSTSLARAGSLPPCPDAPWPHLMLSLWQSRLRLRLPAACATGCLQGERT